MKTKTTLLILLISTMAYGQNGTKRALFLGNSYTYVNDLPQLIADMATSTEDALIFDSYTPGGYLLAYHTGDEKSLNKIKAGGWDYVVLQEQSVRPTSPNYSFAASEFLDSLIKKDNPCASTMFYMTWGRENGLDGCSPPSSPLCTYLGMDSLLRAAYLEMAAINQAEVSPVGAVWQYIRQNYPEIDLYQPDGRHPSIAGSYAAACCFYTALFRKNPTLITINSGLSDTDADNIKKAAKLVVYDSLSNWQIGEYDALKETSCFTPDTNEDSQGILWEIFPNPANSTLVLKFADNNSRDQIQVYNTKGMLLKEIEKFPRTQISIGDFPNGLYLIRLKNHPKQAHKFIKQ